MSLSSPGHAERKLAPAVRAQQAASWSAQAADRRSTDAARSAALESHRATIEAGVTIPTIAVPSHCQAIRFHGPCPYCQGSMFDLDMPLVGLDRPHVSQRGAVVCLLCGRAVATLVIGHRMTPEQFRALPAEQGNRRGRPPGVIPSKKACPHCGIRTTRKENNRCRECWKARVATRTAEDSRP
jgi:hypothetical protein